MKKKALNIKPSKPNRLIVGVDMLQKQTMRLGNLVIFTGSDYTFDNGIKNPNVAQVYSVGNQVKGIKKGDLVICRHNTFSRWVDIEGGYLEGSIGSIGNHNQLFSIFLNDVILILSSDGKAHPLPDRLIVEPIEKPRSSILIDPNPPKHPTRFRVKEAGVNCEGLKKGMAIECYKHSNYLITYHINSVRKEVMVVEYQDVHSIVHI